MCVVVVVACDICCCLASSDHGDDFVLRDVMVVCASMCVPCGGLEQMCLIVFLMLISWLKLVLFVVVVIIMSKVKFVEIMEGLAESKVMQDGGCVVALLS